MTDLNFCDDAIDAKALEIRSEWVMQLWQDRDGHWCWQILGDCRGAGHFKEEVIADEVCRTESEAWVGMREGMDRASRKAAESWIKDQV